MACAGSPGMIAAAPKPDDTDDAKEGTAFHHFAAEILQGRTAAVGDRAPNGYMCDGEMLDHAHAYAACLKSDPSWIARVESAMHWGPGGAAHDGQPWQVRVKVDSVTWRADIKTLRVIDAKYGFRYVDVADNWQLLSQAIGACFALQIQPERIILGIYQPRLWGEPLRTVEITAAELLAAYSMLCTHLDAVTAGTARELTTSEYCRRCPASAGCEAHKQATYNAIDVALDGGVFKVETDQIRARLDLLDKAEEFIKQHKKALEGHALNDLKNGKPVPGLSTKTQLGNTTWRPNVTNQDLREAGNNYMDEKPCTPTEAKRRGMSQELYDKLSHRPVTGVKLIRGDGTAEAAKVFGEDKPKPRKKK